MPAILLIKSHSVCRIKEVSRNRSVEAVEKLPSVITHEPEEMCSLKGEYQESSISLEISENILICTQMLTNLFITFCRF
jgi:hypothetical protein